jgi:hypothetical protein
VANPPCQSLEPVFFRSSLHILFKLVKTGLSMRIADTHNLEEIWIASELRDNREAFFQVRDL